MITAKHVNDFEREVRKWRILSTEEQDNVISKALELFHVKEAGSAIHEPVAWLLRTATFVRKEELRRRNQSRKSFAELCERWTPDRRINGIPVGREIKFQRTGPSQLDRSGTISVACQQALESLTTNERNVAELCWIVGLMPSEAGRILSMGRSTTKSHKVRAGMKLRNNHLLLAIVADKERPIE